MKKSDYRWHEDTDDELQLPVYGEEVIVLVAKPMRYRICFAHRPDPEERWQGYEPVRFGKGGWNIDHVAYWMPCPEIPYNK